MPPPWAAASDSPSQPWSPWPQADRGCQAAHPISSAATAALGFSTEVLNATSLQASWELPPQLGTQGFKLFHHKLPATHVEGPLLLASSIISSFLYTDLGEALNLLVPQGPLLSVVLPQALSSLAQKGLSPS